MKRLVCEAQLVASMNSPHVVQIYDLAVADEDAVCLAMELLDGLDAEEFVYRFGVLEPRRAVRWLSDVCEAVGEVHARGVIHGDIKPANVFVSHSSCSAEHLTLLDFGSARKGVAPDDERNQLRVQKFGTAGYMAPELLRGASGDAHSDVYALGCTAYWLLAGKRVFEADDDDELARLHLGTTPPRLQSSVECSAGLDELIARSLSKSESDRPPDALAFRGSLMDLESDPWSDTDARSWWDAHRDLK